LTGPEAFPRVRRKRRPFARRLAIRVAYRGGAFAGFQRQPGRRTVESEIVHALESLGLTGGLGYASRTDAGVHATGQVIAFRIWGFESATDAAAALAAQLPADIQVKGAAWAPRAFHPRWSAVGKEYVYRLALGGAEPASGTVDLGPFPGDALASAAQELLSCPALDGFTGAGSPRTSAPSLSALRVERTSQGIAMHFRGPAFRRYAIRNMVAVLLAQARGEMVPGSCRAVAASQPPYRGNRAPAEGLTLERVFYPAELDPFGETAASLQPESEARRASGALT
jgi:tRNA pseudouridine38-40 synthase